MYHVTVGGESVGVCVTTLDEAKAWIVQHNPNWDCVVWFGRGGDQSIAATYKNGQWSARS